MPIPSYGKINFLLIIILLISIGFSSCKKKKTITPSETKSELLIKNSWIIDRFSLLDNSTIQEGKLNTSAKLLFLLEFQFRANNQVRAIDKVSKQVFNGGTWELKNNDKNILIDIPGLKDEFILVEITKNKMILRPNEKAFPVIDNNTAVNMEFKPTI
jgi:hypothetical protein